MGFINVAEKTISAKLVYYGIGMGGKTTSLQAVHGIFCPANEVQLVSINTEEDSTLLFDFLPIDLGLVEGFKIRIQGFTVPGQPKYRRMRKYVLSGADAVVLVIDSQRSRLEENLQSLQSMLENLRGNGIDPDAIPIVLQYNKRDLEDILSEEELDEHFKKAVGKDYPSFPSVATEGQGVFETFVHAAEMLVESKVQLYGLGKGDVDARHVADSARQRLWDIHDDVRGVPADERSHGSTVSVTVDEDGQVVDAAERERREAAAAAAAEDVPDEDAELFSDGDLEIELQKVDADELTELFDGDDESAGPTDAVDDEDASEDLEDLLAENGDPVDARASERIVAEGAAAAQRVLDDFDDETPELLDQTIQSNLELARAYGELDRLKTLTERKNRQLVEITQNAVHDLNKPLTALKLTLTTLVRGLLGEVPDRQCEALQTCLKAVGQMERLVGDLMDSSRLDFDGIDMTFQDVDMTLLLGEVLSNLRARIESTEAHIEVEPLPMIVADEWALQKAFANLIGNALDYCHPDRQPRIKISGERVGDDWLFRVADNGIGIPQGEAEGLFQRFQRGSNTAGISGTGLGLHIVREVVRGHGGEVAVESTEGKGSCFLVQVPVEPCQPEHSPLADVMQASAL